MIHNKTHSYFLILFLVNKFYGVYSKQITNYFSNYDEQSLKHSEINSLKKNISPDIIKFFNVSLGFKSQISNVFKIYSILFLF
jgi:hypothetical protein